MGKAATWHWTPGFSASGPSSGAAGGRSTWVANRFPTPNLPPQPPAAAGSATVDPLRTAVDDALRQPRWLLGFSPLLEARFEADTAPARQRSLVIAGLVTLFVYNLFLVNDLLTRPAVFPVAVAWRLGFFTPYGLLMLALIRRGLPPFWREAAMSSTLPMAMLASCMILRATPAPAATYDIFVFSLVFTAGNIVFRLRFVHALASSLAALLVAVVLGATHPAIPPDALPFALGLLAGTAVFTVLAALQAESAARHTHLLMLRETLASQVAQRSASTYAQLSHTDALTQVANRRAFDQALVQAWQAAGDRQQQLALLMVDLDHFKQFNDRHGHPAGDRCLQQVAATLRGAVRDGDLVARMGGEEFAVLLPHCSQAQAEWAAERLRQAVERLALPHDGLPGQPLVTISLGAALARPAAGSTSAGLLQRADEALYQAKRSGRNRWAQAAEAPA